MTPPLRGSPSHAIQSEPAAARRRRCQQLTPLTIFACYGPTNGGQNATAGAIAVAVKLLVAPLVFIGIGLALGLSGTHLAVLAICGAAPSPPAAYILTREMGGNPQFMAGHITATTLLSSLAIPSAIWLAGLFG